MKRADTAPVVYHFSRRSFLLFRNPRPRRVRPGTSSKARSKLLGVGGELLAFDDRPFKQDARAVLVRVGRTHQMRRGWSMP